MRVALLVAAVGLALLGGCKKSGPQKLPMATEADCVLYRNKMFSFFPPAEQESAAKLGMDKPSKLELELCMQRMTADEVACVETKTSLADALACKPKVDVRAAEVKRTPEECTALTAHVMKLANETESGNTIGPPFTPTMAAMFARECERWMTKPRYDCIMKAPSPMGFMMCKP